MMSCKSIGGFPTGFFQMEAQKELQLRGLKNLLTKNHEFWEPPTIQQNQQQII